MKEALKLALEALERINDRFDLESVAQNATKAIFDIKEALAQDEQEPVGSLSVRYFHGAKSMTNTDFDYNGDLPEGDYELYTAPPQRPWVDLTVEDQKILADSAASNNWNDWQMMDAIGSLLKEKNT